MYGDATDLWTFVLDGDLDIVVSVLALNQGGIGLVDIDLELDRPRPVDVWTESATCGLG